MTAIPALVAYDRVMSAAVQLVEHLRTEADRVGALEPSRSTEAWDAWRAALADGMARLRQLIASGLTEQAWRVDGVPLVLVIGAQGPERRGATTRSVCPSVAEETPDVAPRSRLELPRGDAVGIGWAPSGAAPDAHDEIVVRAARLRAAQVLSAEVP